MARGRKAKLARGLRNHAPSRSIEQFCANAIIPKPPKIGARAVSLPNLSATIA
jgi:hypothetical protein